MACSTAVVRTLVLLTLAGTASAGPVNPPVGPVAPTGKTMQEIYDKAAAAQPRIVINATNTPGDADSLYRITQPGSYTLAGNITGVPSKSGIEIAASGVTIDLNGFEVAGVPGSLDGITCTLTSATGIAIRNGTVRSWGGDGVDVISNLTMHTRLAELRCLSNGAHGIRAGSHSIITACQADLNAGHGFDLVTGTTISDCVADGNGGSGFDSGQACTFTNCAAALNGGAGIETDGDSVITGCAAGSNGTYGFDCGIGTNIVHCAARYNTADGILLDSSCLAMGNTCRESGFGAGNGAGIHVLGSDNRLEGNNCSLGDMGISVNASGNILFRNTCSGNTLNWSLVAGNVFGAIVDRTAPASPAVNTNAAAASTGSSDPNANFSY